MVPYASTSYLYHAFVLSEHTRMCVSPLVPLIFDWLPLCCSFPELGALTHETGFSALLCYVLL
jgi:hypothetical protein